MSAGSTDPQLLRSVLSLQNSHWKNGQPILPEHLTAEIADTAVRTQLLIELIHNEVILREESGELPTLEEYQRRYPELADALRIQWALDRFLMGEADQIEATEQHSSVRTIGRYQLLDVLGKGAMGIVYKAWDPELKRLVAVKRLKAGLDATDEQRNRLISEAEAIARLHHENIVQIFDLGRIGDLPYFAIEYCDSGSLAAYINGVPVAPVQAAFVVEQIARGVAVAHENLIVHRDLKPSNVLLQHIKSLSSADPEMSRETDGRPHIKSLVPKVADFGLARLEDREQEQTRTGVIIGTPAYMSPEQVAAKRSHIGPTTDVYSLGAILYECLTGRPPFRAETTQETMRQVVEAEPVAPDRLNPSVPADLSRVVMKCLEKETFRRYQTVWDLAEDLRRFQAGLPVLARPVSPFVRTFRVCRRHPIVSVAVCMMIIGLCLLFLVRENYLRELETSRHDAVIARGRAERLQKEAEDNGRRAEQNAASANLEKLEAQRQLKRAEENSIRAMETVDVLLQKVSDQSLSSIPGMTRIRQQLLEEALRKSEQFLADRGSDDPAALFARGLALQRTGRIHRQNKQLKISETELVEAFDVFGRLTSQHPENLRYAVEYGRTYYQLALTISGLKSRSEAISTKLEVLRTWDTLIKQFGEDSDLLLGKANVLTSLGLDYRAEGRFNDAHNCYSQSDSVLSGLFQNKPDDQTILRNYATLCGNRAALLYAEGRDTECLESLIQTKALWQHAVELSPGDFSLAKSLTGSIMSVAAAQTRIPGMEIDAIRSYEEAVAEADKMARDEPLIADLSDTAARCWLGLSIACSATGDREKAIAAADHAIEFQNRISTQSPSDITSQLQLGRMMGIKAENLFYLGRNAEASALSRQTIALLRPIAVPANGPDVIADYLTLLSIDRMIHSDEIISNADASDALSLARSSLAASPQHRQLRFALLALAFNEYIRLRSLGLFDQAGTLVDECLTYTSDDLTSMWLVRKATIDAEVGSYARAVARIRAIKTFPNRTEFNPSEILAVYTIAAQKAATDENLSEEDKLCASSEYLEQALKVLHAQIEAGNFSRPEKASALLSETELKMLRDHHSFWRLVQPLGLSPQQ